MQNERNLCGAALLAALAIGASGFALWRWTGPDATKVKPDGTAFARDRLEIVTAAGRKSLEIEIAETPAQMAQGLMFRTRLSDGEGMLFLHRQPGEIRMWMKNTYIPLDMVFIRADGTVHRIAARTEPLSEATIASQGEVTAVLEIPGGAAARLGIKPGDKVLYRHFRD